MSNNKREFELIIEEKELVRVLSELGIIRVSEDGNISFTSTLDDTKETYKKLSTLPGIVDWNIKEEEEKEDPEEFDKDDFIVVMDNEEEKKAEIIEKSNKSSELAKHYLLKFNIKNYNDVAIITEAIWRLLKANPVVVFGDDFFNRELEVFYNQVGSEIASINHALLAKIIEAYYFGKNLQEVIEDILEKLQENAEMFSTYNTIVEVAVKLFKKG